MGNWSSSSPPSPTHEHTGSSSTGRPASARPGWPINAWRRPMAVAGTWLGRRPEGSRSIPLGALAHLLPAGIGDERVDLVTVMAEVRPVLRAQADRSARAVRRRSATPGHDVGDVRRSARRRRPRFPCRHRPVGHAAAARVGRVVAPGSRPSHRSRRPRSGRNRHAPDVASASRSSRTTAPASSSPCSPCPATGTSSCRSTSASTPTKFATSSSNPARPCS